MNAIEILTVRKKDDLYKKGTLEKAERIELISFNENEFQVVCQKDLYQIGDRVLYVYPDFNLTENELFDSFIKSGKLGSNNRIRAIKFNFVTQDMIDRGSLNTVFSNGIALPLSEVYDFLNDQLLCEENLGITKISQESNTLRVSGKTYAWPNNLYKTDEDNIKKVAHRIKFPITLHGTLKMDGGSVTFGWMDGEPFIGSRNVKKQIYKKVVVEKRSKKWYEHLVFWKKVDLNIYEEVVNTDDIYVELAYPLLMKIKDRGNLICRGELVGSGNKGSGNRNNPHAKIASKIYIYDMNGLVNNNWVKINPNITERYCEKFGFEHVPVFFNKQFETYEDLMQECELIFSTNMIEGIVVRNYDNSFSCKIMNDEYDSKK